MASTIGGALAVECRLSTSGKDRIGAAVVQGGREGGSGGPSGLSGLGLSRWFSLFFFSTGGRARDRRGGREGVVVVAWEGRK